MSRLWFDIAGAPFPRRVPALTAAGIERLLCGSDYCFTPAPGTTAQLASVDAVPQRAPDTWRSLTTHNAGTGSFPVCAPTPVTRHTLDGVSWPGGAHDEGH